MKKYHKWLILIFLLTLSFRLYFAFQTPNFDYEAYFDLRQITSVTSTTKPIFNDELSYGGRFFFFSPIFHYLLASLSFFISPAIISKIIPNIFASSLVFIIFLIAKKLTKNNKIALFTCFFSAFIPAFIIQTINSISIYSLTIPLIFLIIYLISSLEENKKFTSYAIVLIILLPFIHPSAFILILGLLVYLILVKLEHLKQKQSELELILFSTFLIIWIEFLIYKNALLSHGTSVIWQNTPSILLKIYLTPLSAIESILKIGIVPLLFGIYVIYRYLFREKNKDIYLLISFAISTTLLLWLKLIHPLLALLFLGIICICLFSKAYQLFMKYIKKTRLAAHKKFISSLLLIITALSLIIPSYIYTKEQIQNTPQQEEINALLWLKNNTNKNSIILGTLQQGHLITFISERKNVFDSNFLFIQNPSNIVNDVRTIYITPSKIEAVGLLNNYGVDYIIFSPKTGSEFNINKIRYIDDKECFDLVYSNQTQIYKIKCKLEES